jgi:uncharacterized protein YndB with AHSA1/START domain
MENYQKTIKLNTSPQDVYKAITAEDGIKSWWTVDCKVSTEVGGKSSFYFEKLLFNSMENVELAPSKKVHWKCVEGWNEWIGTEVTFTLTENSEGGTELHFAHKGLTPDLSCYKMCSNGWENTLKSLQDYVNTGKGTPHIPKTGLTGIMARTAFKVFSRKYMK